MLDTRQLALQPHLGFSECLLIADFDKGPLASTHGGVTLHPYRALGDTWPGVFTKMLVT